jgi:transposase
VEHAGDLDALTELLGLEEFEVVDFARDRKLQLVRFTLVPKIGEGLCVRCRTLSEKRHSTGDHVVLDLPMLGCRTELIVRAPQYQCETCHQFFTPRYAAIAQGMHATVRLLEKLGQLVKHGDVAGAAAFFGIPEKTAERWYYQHRMRHREAQSPHRPIECLGIDELSIKKRHRQFACPLIDHTNERVLDVLEQRSKESVVAWLKAGRESGFLASLKEVTIDMWGPYADAVREVFGDTVRIVVDRFHLAQHLQACLAQARRQIQRGLSKEAARDLKGTRWLWAKNPDKLTPEERAKLDTLQQKYPALAQLTEQRDAFRRILEDTAIRRTDEARNRLLEWCEQVRQKGIAALEKFTRTVQNWIEEIANYFLCRSTNARTEGFNHGIRTILWRAFGMSNFAHLRLRVLHAFG